jgi:hypothetical protein
MLLLKSFDQFKQKKIFFSEGIHKTFYDHLKSILWLFHNRLTVALSSCHYHHMVIIIIWSLQSSYAHFTIVLWSIYNHLMIILQSSYDYLQSPYNHFKIITRSFYNPLMIILRPSHDHFTTILWSPYSLHFTIIYWQSSNHLTIILWQSNKHISLISQWSYDHLMISACEGVPYLKINHSLFSFKA